ncbi:MAG: DUF3566 domain-containing protein [Candidatus Zixiibacteriota bacterium]
MKLELKRISLWATIKISFVLNLVFGFVVGCFYALIFAAIAVLPSAAFQDSPVGEITGVFALMIPFFMAFFVAVINTIFAFVLVLVYNFAARTMGGFEFEFSKVDDPATTAPPAVTTIPTPPTPPTPAQPPQSPYSPYSQRPTEPPQDFSI